MTLASRRREVLAFFALALALFFVVDLAADVAARMAIRGEPPGFAARDHLHYAWVQLVGTLFLALPFLGLATIGLPLLRHRGWAAGVLFLAVFALALGGVSFFGYQQSAMALAQKHWTGAALSVAFIPFMSVPVLAIAWLVRFFFTRAS